MSSARVFVLAVLCAVLVGVGAQLSRPIATERDAPKKNKFLEREALEMEDHMFGKDATGFHDECAIGLEMNWQTELGASIYATPLITDVYGDGHKEVVVSTFTRFLEVVEGSDGHKAPGWPLSSVNRVFHSSPVTYDYDGDGVRDFIFTTGNAEVIFVRENGIPFYGSTLVVPKLKIQKNWYEALDQGRVKVSETYVPPPTEAPADGMREINLEETASASQEPSYFAGMEGWLSDEAIESLKLFMPDNPHAMTDPLLFPRNKLPPKDPTPGFVMVDAHLLSSPAIADIDNDGAMDLVLAVSYFFDREQYTADSSKFAELDVDVDLSKYVAGGIVVFDLDTMAIKWSIHLDLTTEDLEYRAYIYSSPVVGDVDGDGFLEIVVGTSCGFLYVLEHDGTAKENFPVVMREIQGAPTLADVDGDGVLDMIAVDSHGNVGCFNHLAEEVWETRVSGFSPQNPVVGDVDGDGELDVVIATVSGHIWALKGSDGELVDGFPVKTAGRILSPVLLMKTEDGQQGLHVVVPAFDGYLYLINGRTQNVCKFDLGENTYAQVLTDDVSGDGKMDLVVSSMNGNVFCVETDIPFHPLRTWTSQMATHGVSREGYLGIAFTADMRTRTEVSGSSMWIEFEITDSRAHAQEDAATSAAVTYTVTAALGGSDVLLLKTFDQPGVYRELIPCPNRAQVGTLVLSLQSDHMQTFQDTLSVRLNLAFYKTIKHILVLPFVAMASILLFVRDLKTPLLG